MKTKNIVVGLVTIATLSASAGAAAGSIEANVAIASDYVFRGFSQTDEEPAISGGFDYAFDNGFYLGTWASNVNFGDDASLEWDLYGGYAFDVSENVGLDFGYIYYVYPGEQDALNYSEFVASVSFGNLNLGLVYSPDYFGSDADAIVLSSDYSLSVAKNVGLDLHVGFSDVDEDSFFADGEDSYLDWSAALTTSVSEIDIALTYYGTDLDDIDAADDRVVLSFAKSF